MASIYPDTGSESHAPLTIRDWLARRGLESSINAVKHSVAVPVNVPKQADTEKTKPKGSEITVGIIGAGCAGLYAAMILKSLGIKFELLEGSHRVGGRVRTHHFSDKPHDYFDVGAMRFPRLWFMRRLTVDLFGQLGLNSKVVPYYMDPRDDEPNVRQYYNKQEFVGKATPVGVDTFGIGKNPDGSGEGIVPKEYVLKGARALTEASFAPILSIFTRLNQKDIDDAKRLEYLAQADEAMRKLDTFSTRSWLKLFGIFPSDLPPGTVAPVIELDQLLKTAFMPNSEFGFPPAVIQWLETTNTGTTGWYDMALTQTLMELADFGDNALGVNGWRPEDSPIKDYDWVCIDGGSEEITKAMLANIKVDEASIVNKRVSAVKANKDSDLLEVSVAGENGTKAYDQVICTATLGCMATMDLDDCVSYSQSVAIRCLQYDASCKIGVQFTNRWWQDEAVMGGKAIYGGVSKSDLPLSNVVYPSYGANDPKDAPGVLICSYTWAQDARRLGALIGQGGEMSQELRELVVRDLAKIHSVKPEDIDERITGSYAYSWYNDPYYRGAFAIFGPSQFYDTTPADEHGHGGASLFDSVKVPGAGGRFHIAGEATSTHHGWIIGALNSAWRAVNNVIKGCSDEQELRDELVRLWKVPDEEPEQKVTDRGYKLGVHNKW